jgi:isopentenyl phosphate kinase
LEFYKLNEYLPREDIEEMVDEEEVYQAYVEAIKSLNNSYSDIRPLILGDVCFDLWKERTITSQPKIVM